MIEKIIISYLGSVMNINVYAERPENPPEEYILIQRTSRDRENWITSDMIVVQSISSLSKLRAATINDELERAMRDLTDLENISRCKLNSSYDFTDTETKEYRYQAVFDITYMEEYENGE